MGGVDEEGSGKARGMEGPTWSTQTYRFICCVGSGTWLSLSKLSDPTEEKQQFGVSQRQKRVTVVVAILTTTSIWNAPICLLTKTGRVLACWSSMVQSAY